MPTVSGNGVQIYWEATGEGVPMVWVHEYGGDLRSWEPQVRYFSRRYRVITYNQRGYPPSTVPTAARDYSQALLVEDLRHLIAQLTPGPVHLGGCSMGANVARDFALTHPDVRGMSFGRSCGIGRPPHRIGLAPISSFRAGRRR